MIEHRGGAGGNIGTEQAARAKPDGYTLVMGSSSPNAINVHLYPRLGLEPLKDFAPISLVATVPNIPVVPANSPINSVQDVLAAARPSVIIYFTICAACPKALTTPPSRSTRHPIAAQRSRWVCAISPAAPRAGLPHRRHSLARHKARGHARDGGCGAGGCVASQSQTEHLCRP